MARKKPISRLLVSGHTLSTKECAFLIDLYDRYSELSDSRDYNRRPLLHYYTVREVDSESASRVYGVSLRCKKKIEVDLRSPELFVESFFVACLLSGDNFTGGELVFPDRDVVIIPKPGLLVAFPSNHKFVHAVRKVLSGKRYSVLVWFTVDPAKAMQV